MGFKGKPGVASGGLKSKAKAAFKAKAGPKIVNNKTKPSPATPKPNGAKK